MFVKLKILETYLNNLKKKEKKKTYTLIIIIIHTFKTLYNIIIRRRINNIKKNVISYEIKNPIS